MNDPQPMLSSAQSVLIGVKDLAAARSFYEGGMGLTCVGRIDDLADDMRKWWGIGDGAVRMVRLAKPGERFGMVDLMEWEGGTGELIRDPARPWDYGLLTLNFRVGNLDRAVAHLAGHGASVVSAPQSYEAAPGRRIREVMINAPGGERHTLLQIGEATEGDEYPLADAVATVGMIVPSLREARAFYHQALGLTVSLELEGSGEPFSTLMGTPAGTKLRLLLLTSGGNWTGKLEALELTLPEGGPVAQDTGARANGRYVGHWMVSFLARDFDLLVGRCRAAGVELLQEPLTVERPFVGHTRAVRISGPGGVPLEVLAS